MVLLKAVDGRGFVFYTNWRSPKARDLQQNREAELCFHWAPLEKQVRVHGRVEPVSAAEADVYFATRPRLSQLAAHASRQSEPMPHRLALHEAIVQVGIRFGVNVVPRPPHWSGFRVIPDCLEFWRQRPFRQHERLRYTREGAEWRKEWLFP
jgi:pyridoxamine 5'-phosphate oxidase